ncbi:pentatricopeptide repeat domain-containing protein [Spizellomyces punctatus DAOM BR117]|uniref:Pentatricopeptide repeat domain-containing protein n=1 Tax=Spizellomyces punctatus (strain DAOM BR117) TaxID=645134 RepID=A0A0L0HSE7_SPIPD|nr:pentatricopeptide repeat domain-containing protein [Spizellomyces punctatus DAOM BR117]KND03830.1 pentatricopeptide repeat domain-containing protein [Spizellomyces punctatus DAOM BR117]|eukprot:XP_016611869.1 pentatricopeptide repeat domain-containing protein [Spizellomyces punctatus DAOM BR117]
MLTPIPCAHIPRVVKHVRIPSTVPPRTKWCRDPRTLRADSSREHIALYASQLNVAAKHNLVSDAQRVVETMRSKGLSMDLKMYTTLMALHGRVGDLRGAWGWYHRMLANKIKPDGVVVNVLVDMYASAGDMEGLEWVVNMLHPDMDIKILTGVIKGCVRAGDPRAALSVFQKVVEWGVVPDAVMKSVVVEALMADGDFEGAKEVLRGETHVHVFGKVLSGLIKMGRLEEADEVLTVMRERGIKSIVLSSLLMDTYAKRGDTGRVEQILKDMHVEGSVPDVHVYTVLVWMYVHVIKDMNAARMVIQEMVNKNVRPNTVTMNVYVTGMVRYESVEAALEVLRRWEGADIAAYTVVLNALVKMGPDGLERAVALFRTLTASSCLPQPDRIAYTVLMGGYCQTFETVPIAHTLFEEMVQRGIEPDAVAYNTLLSGHARFGLVESGIRVYISMLEQGIPPTVETLTMLIQMYIQHRSHAHPALLHLYDMFKSTRIRPDHLLFTSLARAFSIRRDTLSLQRILKEMQETYHLTPTPHMWRILLQDAKKDPEMVGVIVREMIERGVWREELAKGVRPFGVFVSFVGDAWVVEVGDREWRVQEPKVIP